MNTSDWVVWSCRVHTHRGSVVAPARTWSRTVVASDCEHAAEVAAERFRRDNGAWPFEVVVSDGDREWTCAVDYVRGGAVAVSGPGVTAG